jgi:hypothetical protein
LVSKAPAPLISISLSGIEPAHASLLGKQPKTIKSGVSVGISAMGGHTALCPGTIGTPMAADMLKREKEAMDEGMKQQVIG